jgi:predicted transposase YbfD/YdcC
MLSEIYRVFATFKEYRTGKVAKGRPRHPLLGLLMILFLARVAGCRGWDASADWARAHFELLGRCLPVWKRPPGADTLRRTAEAYALTTVLDAIGAAEDGTVHIDGKRLRGATHDGQVHHLIEALCGGTVIGMVEMGAGAEGPAMAGLLHGLDLAGKLVTIDAGGTTPAVAAAIRLRGGDYLLAVKGNQPALSAALEAAFASGERPAHITREHGHGRHEIRRAQTIATSATVAAVAAAATIPDIACLCRIERTRITPDGIETTVHYHVSSRRLTPRRYARITRSHWRIEAMHHVLDGALNEDASRICDAAAAWATLCRLAYAVLAEMRGKLSFRRCAEFFRANPRPLLEACKLPELFQKLSRLFYAPALGTRSPSACVCM